MKIIFLIFILSITAQAGIQITNCPVKPNNLSDETYLRLSKRLGCTVTKTMSVNNPLNPQVKK